MERDLGSDTSANLAPTDPRRSGKFIARIPVVGGVLEKVSTLGLKTANAVDRRTGLYDTAT